MDLLFQIPHENRCNLGSGGGSLRSQGVVFHAVDEAGGNRPVHGIDGPAADRSSVGEVSQSIFFHSFRTFVAVQDGGNLLSGDVGVGGEGGVVQAIHDAFVGSPDDSIGVPLTLSHVSEGILQTFDAISVVIIFSAFAASSTVT